MSSLKRQAEAPFVRGLAALHPCWYPVGLDDLWESTDVDPNCMMGYGGEAMAYNLRFGITRRRPGPDAK